MSLSWTRRFALIAAFGAVLGSSACLAEVPPSTATLAGAYQLDPTHASVTFKISHFGLSNYTARFTKIDAKVNYDPAHPEKSTVEASVNPASIRTDYPAPEKVDFDKELGGEKWFNVAKFPDVTFKSTKIEVTGKNTAKITGDLTLLGVTKSVTLDTVLNLALDAHPFTKAPALGISATATIDRTAFGLSAYAPNVGAEVKLLIEAEFLKK
jgi:polyisoprenoid-binding protein YceI